MKRQQTIKRALGRRATRRTAARRGVTSVLAMMFMVIFSSLAAAMAVVAQSNLRTASSGLKLSRAMSAAETGLVFATHKLSQEAGRFVVEKGVIDAEFAEQIWLGTYDTSAVGAVTIASTSYDVTPGAGIVHALAASHAADSHFVSENAQPNIDQYGTLMIPAIALTDDDNSAYFTLTYQLLVDVPYGDPHIRVISKGVDGDISRTLEMAFRIDKRIEFAVLSPNRIMIGKNVLVEGPLGSMFGGPGHEDELDSPNGHPIIMRSDFYGLDPALDALLDTFYAKVQEYDADGDNRLRPRHPTERLGLAGNPDLQDYDGDEYVDDFDLFLAHFDANSDGMVVYNADLAAAAGIGSLPVEFSGIDEQLARLIDEAIADRDGDGIPGTMSDRMLGWKDGVIDERDRYAKVHGRLLFATSRSNWEQAQGNDFNYQSEVLGPIRTELETAPAKFEVTEDEMRAITTEMFNDTQSWFRTKATGAISPSDIVDYVWEPVPYGAVEVGGENFGSRGAYDYYYRPRYVGQTFTNLRIPKNTNALFENCVFVGVTYIETEEDCDDPDWNLVGALEKKEDPDNPGSYIYVERWPEKTVEVDGNTVVDTRVHSNNIRFHNCTFLGSLAGDKPSEYTHWRNKIQMTGATRFYLDRDDPDLAEQVDAEALLDLLNNIPQADIEELQKSSILMPGWSVDVGSFTNEQAPDPTETPKIKLKGTIIAGILDVRGTADVHGTLLMTYRPVPGEGPLYYGGMPENFNTTLGYFFTEDGDSEGGDAADANFEGYGEITLRYDPEAKLPDGIPWPLRITPDPRTYSETAPQ